MKKNPDPNVFQQTVVNAAGEKIEITVTPWYDEAGDPFKYTGKFWWNEKIKKLECDPPVPKSAENQPPSRIWLLYETNFEPSK